MSATLKKPKKSKDISVEEFGEAIDTFFDDDKSSKPKARTKEDIRRDALACATDDVASGPRVRWKGPVDEKPLSQLEREYLDDIGELNGICGEAELVMISTKREAKDAKDYYDEVVTRLRARISKGVSNQPNLPGFEDPKEDDAWRDAPIRNAIKLTDKQYEKLLDNDIETAGDFEHIRGGNDKDYPRGLHSIKGVGQATVDKWEQEMLDWLAKNQASDLNKPAVVEEEDN